MNCSTGPAQKILQKPEEGQTEKCVHSPHCVVHHTSQFTFNVEHSVGITDYRYILMLLFKEMKTLLQMHLPKISQILATFQSTAELK